MNRWLGFTSLVIAAAAALPSCASAPTDEEVAAARYRLYAIPGPTERETKYAFARNSLTIRVNGELKDGIPTFHVDFQNMGSSRITIHQAMVTIRGGSPARARPTTLRDAKDMEVTKITILGHDDAKFEVRLVDSAAPMDGAIVLEMRGIRDENGDGGYDFDLYAEPQPLDPEGRRAP